MQFPSLIGSQKSTSCEGPITLDELFPSLIGSQKSSRRILSIDGEVMFPSLIGSQKSYRNENLARLPNRVSIPYRKLEKCETLEEACEKWEFPSLIGSQKSVYPPSFYYICVFCRRNQYYVFKVHVYSLYIDEYWICCQKKDCVDLP